MYMYTFNYEVKIKQLCHKKKSIYKNNNYYLKYLSCNENTCTHVSKNKTAMPKEKRYIIKSNNY